MNRFFFLLPALVFVLNGCVSLGRYDDLQKRHAEMEKQYAQLNQNKSAAELENNELRSKNARLTAELTQLRKSPELLYNKGMELYKDGNYIGAVEQLEKVSDRYPADPLSVSALEKIAEINALASTNYQKTLKALEGIKDLKARVEYLDKETGEKFFSVSDLEKLAHKKEAYLNDLRMQEEATKHILIEDDPTQSTRYYRSTRASTQEIDRDKIFYIEIYIAQHYSGQKRLRLKSMYIGNKWISYDSVILRNDSGTQMEVICKYPDKMSNMSSDRIYEWSDNDVDDDKMIKLIKSGPISVRFNGGYKFTFVLDDEQLVSFKEIVKKYQALK